MNKYLMLIVTRLFGLTLIVSSIISFKYLFDFELNIKSLEIFALRFDVLADSLHHDGYRATISLVYGLIGIAGILMLCGRFTSKHIKSHISLLIFYVISSGMVFVNCIPLSTTCVQTNVGNTNLAFLIIFLEFIILLDWSKRKYQIKNEEKAA